MIFSKYSEIDGKMYVEASDYDKILYELKNSNEKIAELESELEVKDNLLKIKNGLCGNDEMKDKEPIEIAMDIIKGRNIDDLEQIAQHIQVYCRHARSRCDDAIAF